MCMMCLKYRISDHTINCYKESVEIFTHIFFAPGRRPVPRWGAYSAPQTPSWSARTVDGSHIENLSRSRFAI